MQTAVRISEPCPERVPSCPEEDAYYYGHRTVLEYDENGRELYYYRPLTPDDFLDPEEGDVFMQGTLHEKDLDDLKSIFRGHLQNRKNITVYSDMKIVWGIPGLSSPAPDISIFENVRDPEKPRSVFSVAEEGVKPFFILELVSPRYRREDILRKPEIYRRAGVAEYIIADPGLRRSELSEISYTVQGYRLRGKNRYELLVPDARGRIYSHTTDLWIGPSESGDRIIIYNGKTDEPILPAHQRANLAESRAEQEKARAEQEKARADSAEQELTVLREKLKALGISAQ
ncbi:MAG: Uma2 family endonuclease [Desulfobacterales bacterium]